MLITSGVWFRHISKLSFTRSGQINERGVSVNPFSLIYTFCSFNWQSLLSVRQIANVVCVIGWVGYAGPVRVLVADGG